MPAAIALCCAVGLTACGERAEQKSFPLSECRDKLLADIGKNYPNARVIYEVFEDHTNTEGPVKIYDEVARVPVTIVDPEYPKELRHSLIVSGFPDLRAAELGEEATLVQSPVEWALSRLKEKGGRSVSPNEVRSASFLPSSFSSCPIAGARPTLSRKPSSAVSAWSRAFCRISSRPSTQPPCA